jgi:hypothetical protein
MVMTVFLSAPESLSSTLMVRVRSSVRSILTQLAPGVAVHWVGEVLMSTASGSLSQPRNEQAT